uniref:LisH domain-containing protein n=1 Tax=Ditylenchus dipsaci TaxID=166011 RepID=A0A915EGU7_9BILA
MNPSARSSALLLQALRQQITRTPSLAVADENIQQFASKDILSLRNRKNSVLATILTQTEPATEPKEELARFLNSIASFRNGRKYLLSIGQGKEMLYQVALALRTKRLTHFAADQSLAALQKLSNASASQKPSNLGMEFGTALLMNLCLNSVVSQSTVIRYKDQLLNLLSHLLTSKNVQLIPYVCGTLYCLLGAHSRFRQAARERDLETILNSQIPKTSSLEVQRQLGVVLAMLKGELEYDRKKKQSDEEDECLFNKGEKGDYSGDANQSKKDKLHLASPKKRVQKPEKHNPTYNKRDAWKDVDIDEPITLLHDYANQTDLLEESAALAAVEDKMASTRIPDDADAQEYVSIFGSRPKVIRTPDQRQQTNVTGELSYTAAAGSRHLIVSHH